MRPRSESTRRQFFTTTTGITVASLIASSSSAQGQQQPIQLSLSIVPRDFGKFHFASLDMLWKTLGTVSPNSRDGLLKVLDLLAKSGLISQAEREALQKIIHAIFDSKSIAALAQAIDKIGKELVDKAQPLAVALVSIVRSSVEYVEANARGIDYLKVTAIVSSDLAGAFAGAVGCIAASFLPAVTALGALFGAVAGSSNVALAARASTK